MFSLGILGLVAAYVLIAVLLLSINLYSNWSWKIKAGAIMVTSIFYIVTYFSFPPLLGWPTSAGLPQRFQMVASYVEQPNKATGADGAVYLWLKEIDNLASPEPPRAFRLEYSDELHERVINAKSKLDKGIPQLGELEDHDNMIDDVRDTTRTGQKTVNIQFYDLPDPMFPDK